MRVMGHFAESASGEAKPRCYLKETAEKKKPVQLTPLQLAKKECDDAIMQRDYQNVRYKKRRQLTAVEKDLWMRQKIN